MALKYIFLFFCFFPYIQIVPLSTDSQPYGLIFGGLIVFLNKSWKLNKDLFMLFLIAITSIFIFFFSPFDFNSIRSLVNYISIFIIAWATYIVLSDRESFSFNLFKKCVYVWLVFGLVQQFVYRPFGSFLISRLWVGYGDRGMSALAPEPTFYAIICVLFSIICFLNFSNEKEYKRIQILLLIQIVLLSRSATIIMFGGFAIMVYCIFILMRRNLASFMSVIIVTAIMVIVVPILLPYITQYRVGKLLSLFIENPALFITSDDSVNERFTHAFFPIHGFCTNYGLPHFYGNFQEYLNTIYNSGEFSEYISFFRNNSRIMSGFGSIFFELGFIAILLVYIIIHDFIIIGRKRQSSFLFCLMFLIVLLNAMPFSNSLIGFVIGNIIYCSDKILIKKHLSCNVTTHI
ncbi:hypothetical protein [uncultured Duncaniella sp.]|uniref:hypothetical protein n=1 Tax=uncultured Duncaniella sp. TaxID=2768039 RepID=UPI00267739E9|nr:hypothetical protein [uncultured Duncaniella sp.]